MSRLRWNCHLLMGLFPVFIAVSSLSAQQAGCTDPQALNYDTSASVNDGSCQYPHTTATARAYIPRLSNRVHETSGLIYWKGNLWTHNDSGGDAEIYRLDTLKGRVRQTISIANARNSDWEDIAQDDHYIYIGDVGNNVGNRRDQCVYKIEKAAIPETGDVSLEAEIIYFSYGDQKNYEPDAYNHNFDCEALIAFGDKLLLFSKNWADLKSRVYELPKIAGTHILEPKGILEVDGLITGADLSSDGKQIALCGYKDYEPFLMLIYDFSPGNIFSGNKRRIAFTGMFGTQTEGITYFSDDSLLISAEKTPIAPARVYRFYPKIYTAPALGNP
ncbi:MAG: hypothetical protein RBS33_08045 [Lentimicrobium sp.]|nr:hypothetical protein [Lentimicrobium sp.]